MGYRSLTIVSLLLIAVLVAAGVALRERRLHVLAPTDVRPEPYDQHGWHSGSATRRIAMARHVTTSGELVGQPLVEVVARFGPPLDGATDRHLKWFLGERESAASMMFPYREQLVVSFDERGACQGAVIINLD